MKYKNLCLSFIFLLSAVYHTNITASRMNAKQKPAREAVFLKAYDKSANSDKSAIYKNWDIGITLGQQGNLPDCLAWASETAVLTAALQRAVRFYGVQGFNYNRSVEAIGPRLFAYSAAKGVLGKSRVPLGFSCSAEKGVEYKKLLLQENELAKELGIGITSVEAKHLDLSFTAIGKGADFYSALHALPPMTIILAAGRLDPADDSLSKIKLAGHAFLVIHEPIDPSTQKIAKDVDCIYESNSAIAICQKENIWGSILRNVGRKRFLMKGSMQHEGKPINAPFVLDEFVKIYTLMPNQFERLKEWGEKFDLRITPGYPPSDLEKGIPVFNEEP